MGLPIPRTLLGFTRRGANRRSARTVHHLDAKLRLAESRIDTPRRWA